MSLQPSRSGRDGRGACTPQGWSSTKPHRGSGSSSRASRTRYDRTRAGSMCATNLLVRWRKRIDEGPSCGYKKDQGPGHREVVCAGPVRVGTDRSWTIRGPGFHESFGGPFPAPTLCVSGRSPRQSPRGPGGDGSTLHPAPDSEGDPWGVHPGTRGPVGLLHRGLGRDPDQRPRLGSDWGR